MFVKVTALSAAVIVAAGVSVVASAPAASAKPPIPHGHSLGRSADRDAARAVFAQRRLASRIPQATTRTAGLSISVPSSVTVFNKKKARVAPKVKVGSGVRKVITSKRVTVYAGKKRVASGTSARLRAGRYKIATTVRYRTFNLVTKHKRVTTRTFHDGGYPDSTRCIVNVIDDTGGSGDGSGVSDDGYGGPTSVGCTNGAYPGQTVVLNSDTFYWDIFYDSSDNYVSDGSSSNIGRVLFTSDVAFAGYYTTATRSVAYTVKTWTGSHKLTTRKRTLKIKDGGYQRVFSGYGGEYGSDFNTRYFRVPSRWKLAYSYDCSLNDYPEGNWILDVHKRGNPSYADDNLNNDIDSSDTSLWRLKGAGTFRLHVFTQCVWVIIVRWR